MKMNHLNLSVPDVAATETFFATYFDMKTILDVGRKTLVMMQDDSGLILNISNFSKATEVSYPKEFHVGFYLDSRAEVDAQHARLADSGLTMGTPHKEPGRYGFYIDSPGGFATEVACLEMPTR